MSPFFILGVVFTILGAGLLAGGGYLFWSQKQILDHWPEVQAHVISARLEETSSTDSDGVSSTSYRTHFQLRFTFGGRTYETTGMSTMATSDLRGQSTVIAENTPGSTMRIRVNPERPADVRIDADYTINFFGAAVILAGIGLVFFTIGVIFSTVAVLGRAW